MTFRFFFCSSTLSIHWVKSACPHIAHEVFTSAHQSMCLRWVTPPPARCCQVKLNRSFIQKAAKLDKLWKSAKICLINDVKHYIVLKRKISQLLNCRRGVFCSPSSFLFFMLARNRTKKSLPVHSHTNWRWRFLLQPFSNLLWTKQMASASP